MLKRGRKPGTPKTGGRRPGSQNKASAEIKQWIETIIQDNKPEFEKNIKLLEPEKQVAAIERLLSYIVAKPQNVDISLEYRHLEKLLARTPEEYIEKISMKLIQLNTINNSDHEE